MYLGNGVLVTVERETWRLASLISLLVKDLRAVYITALDDWFVAVLPLVVAGISTVVSSSFTRERDKLAKFDE